MLKPKFVGFYTTGVSNTIHNFIICLSPHLDNNNPPRQSGNSRHTETETQTAPNKFPIICVEKPVVEIYPNGEKHGDEDAAEDEIGVVWDASWRGAME
jgi:hypothetical protein